MLPSETMIWQPEFTDKTLSRKPGAVQDWSALSALSKSKGWDMCHSFLVVYYYYYTYSLFYMTSIFTIIFTLSLHIPLLLSSSNYIHVLL
ncbi:hypothetical protein AUQ09_03035 [Escherichia coli]|nr:hypothetical protein CYQ10_21740 [Escherichia coli]KXQ61919.1 hypothetical protein AUQ09_03035 [Escherichia coli]HAJ3706028.1 hypothetical protein [Escherichia coli]